MVFYDYIVLLVIRTTFIPDFRRETSHLLVKASSRTLYHCESQISEIQLNRSRLQVGTVSMELIYKFAITST